MQHHKIFRLNATLIIFRVALSFTFHIVKEIKEVKLNIKNLSFKK